MSEQELQTEDTVITQEQEVIQESPETVESGADLAPDSDGEHEKQPFTEQQQVTFDKAVGRHVAGKHEERRAKESAQQEVEQLKQQLTQYNQQAEPIVPEFPDELDEDFDEKKIEWQKQVSAKADHVAKLQVQGQIQQQTQLAQQQQFQQDLVQKLDTYTKRAKAAGISDIELQEAGNTVAQYGLQDNLVIAILGDENGALITKHLAANPLEIETLRGMTEYQAAIHINSVITPKAVKFKPKTTETPSPATNLSGNGTNPQLGKYKHIGGAKFE